MRQYERIRYEETREAIWITLARPDELNLVDDALFSELLDAFVRARFDDDHSVVVLRGSGRLFSGGGNLKSDVAGKALAGGPDVAVEMFEHVYHEYPVFTAIETCPKTTIAALNGDAWGAAVDIVMMCDLAIAVREARMSFAPGRWGIADAPNSARLTARVGSARAKDLLYTARPIAAEEALAAGLVTRVCEKAEFDAAVLRYVEDVLTTSPMARQAVKRIVARQLPAFDPDSHFTTAIGKDFRDGVTAFREGRPTPWSADGLRGRVGVPSPTFPDADSLADAKPDGQADRATAGAAEAKPDGQADRATADAAASRVPATAATAADARLVFVRSNFLDGSRPARPDTTVVVADGRIVHVTHDHVELGPDDRLVDLAGKSIVPGLVMGRFRAHRRSPAADGGPPEGIDRPPGVLLARAVQALRSALASGVTGVVGGGSPHDLDAQLKAAIDEGVIRGPRLLPAGPRFGGGPDVAWEWWHDRQNPGVEAPVTGAGDIQRQVRAAIKHGAAVVVAAPWSGEVAAGRRRARNLSTAELRLLVQVAHERGVRVRAEAITPDEILECLDAGVDILDRCDGIDRRCVARMADAGAYLVPGLLGVKHATARAAAGDGATEAALRAGYDKLVAMLPEANDAGVRILPGDDDGLVSLDHGAGGCARELDLYVNDVGVKPLDVLRWATVHGAELFGGDSMGAGILREGASADLLVIDGDPTADITLFGEPARYVQAVVKGGVFEKDELA